MSGQRNNSRKEQLPAELGYGHIMPQAPEVLHHHHCVNGNGKCNNDHSDTENILRFYNECNILSVFQIKFTPNIVRYFHTITQNSYAPFESLADFLI